MERTGRRRGHWIRDSSRGIPSPARGRTHPDAAAAPRLAHQLDGGPWRWLLLIFQRRPPVPRTASTRRMTTNGDPHPMTSALTATATPSSPTQGTKHTNRATEKPADIKFESC